MKQVASLSGPEKAKVRSLVVVIDDDPSVRHALSSLFRSVDFQVALFESPRRFLDDFSPESADCLVLDVRLPALSGLEFQLQINATETRLPIVFMTGHGDIPMSVRAMKAGAIDFLTKPFRDQDMLDAVASAIAQRELRRKSDQLLSGLKARQATLSSRESEVMRLVCAGQMNKQIASTLDRSEVTIKMHRGRVMQKMQARTFAELVKMGELLGVE